MTNLCTERLCARVLLRSAQTFDHVGQITSCFVGTSSTIDNVDKFEGTYRPLCTRRRREERLCYCAPGAVAPAKVGTRNRCPVTITEIEHNVAETLQQSFVSYVAVWTECHAAASVRRRFRARLVPAAEDSYEEREIC